MTLARARCFNHADREAAFSCPACQRYYCRECGTEHAGRIICAACLRTLTAPKSAPRRAWAAAGRLLLAGGGLFIAWLCFYFVGQILLAIPVEYHDGTVWTREQADF